MFCPPSIRLADSIADEDFLGDKNYAKKVYQKAENLAARSVYESMWNVNCLVTDRRLRVWIRNAVEKKKKVDRKTRPRVDYALSEL